MQHNTKPNMQGFPPGYSTEKWDPNERPIVVAGTVFDANSLGKWIFDWSLYAYGCGSPMSNVAGDLWVLLIRFAGHFKFACAHANAIEDEDDLETVSDFLTSGERLWMKLYGVVKACEDAMVDAETRMNGGAFPRVMSSVGGRAFVKTLFGRDRKLRETEKLIASMRLWIMRFMTDCATVFPIRPRSRST